MLTATVAGTALGAGVVGLRTETGREVLTRYGVSVLNEVVHGTADVGEVSGTLHDGLTVRDVVIRGEDGTLLVYFPEVILRYSLLDFLSARIALGRVVLIQPQLNIVRLPNGRYNYEEVLGLGGSGGGGGRKPLVAFRRAEIHGATVVIRNPTEPSDDPRVETELTNEGLMRVRRIDDLNATVSYARISSPFPGENALRFDIEELSARFSDPALDIRSMRGRLEIDGDSIALDLSRFALPGSDVSLRGTLRWPGGDLLLSLDIDARRWAMDDIRPFVDDVPWGLVGDGRATVTSLDGDRLRVHIDPMRLRGPAGGGEVAGRFDILVTGEGWTLGDTELRFDTLAVDYLRPMLDSIPFDGWLTGRLLVSGPSDSLQTDVSLWFRDGLVAGTPETHLRGRGTVSLGTEGGFGFDRFLLDSSDIDLGTVRRVVPPVELQGRVALIGELNGPWGNTTFEGTAQHRHGNGPISVARGVVRLDHRTDTVGVWAQLELDSLRFAGVHASYPRLPERGVFGGRATLSGFADSLGFRIDAEGPPGRVVATGYLVLLPDVLGVQNLNAQVRRLSLGDLESMFPPTELYGRVHGGVSSDSAAGLVGELSIVLDASFAAGSPIDGMRGVVRFENRMIFADSLRLTGPSMTLIAHGGLGLIDARPGVLRVLADVDSLATIEPLLRERFPRLEQDSIFTRMIGSVDAEVTLAGSIDEFEADIVVSVPLATSVGAWLEGLDVRATLPASPRGALSVVGRADSLALGRYAYSDLELSMSGRRNAATWLGRVRLGSEGSWIAWGRTEVDSGQIRIPVEFMGLLLPTHRWFLEPGAVVTVTDSALDLANVLIKSEDGGAWVEMEGQIPRGGATGSLSGSWVRLPLSDVWGLAQLDTEHVGGDVGGTLELSGSATAPVWHAAFQVNDGRFRSFRIPLLETTVGYENQRLVAEGTIWRLAQPILTLDLDLPLDLALEGAEQRQLPGPLTINATADGVDLSLMELVTPLVRNAVGQLDANVGITGTWREPQLTGTLALTDAGAFLPGLGVTHENISGSVVLAGDTIRVDRLVIGSGGGTAEITGFVRLQDLTQPIVELGIVANQFRTLDVPDFLAFTMTGDLSLDGPIFGATLRGRGTLSETDLYFADLIQKRIINLEDTLYAFSPSFIDRELLREEGLLAALQIRLLDSLRIEDLALEMGSNVRLLSTEADIALTGRLLIGKVADQYRFDGTLNAPRGTYRLSFGSSAGLGELIVREFTVTGGQVQYFGTPDLNAGLNIDARYNLRTTKGEDLTIFVNVGGTLYAPDLTLSSDFRPPLPEDEVISYLLFNAPSVEALGGQELGFLRSQLLGALSSQIGGLLISDLGVPLSYLSIRPPSQGLSGTEVALGWQIGPKTYVTLSPRICQQQEVFHPDLGASVEYRFTQNWLFSASRDPVNTCSVLGGPSRAIKSQLGVDLFWEKRY
ncbi:MAG: translocation/assembly module TamB [Gemmatimonadetes bacterium]|nr:translocation/assembly module TamB [Gemmatimonadota bacterium]